MVKKIKEIIEKYSVLLFMFFVLVYWELLNANLIYSNILLSGLYPVFIALICAIVVYLIINVVPLKFKKYILLFSLVTWMFIYLIYYIYYRIFQTPLSLYSLTGASDAMQFSEVAFNTIGKNILSIGLYVLPMIFFKILNLNYSKIDKRKIYS